MKSTVFALCASVLPFADAAAQATDIGLQMDSSVPTFLFGQECGPVGCLPFTGPVVPGGQTRTLFHGSAPQTLYAIAIGFPGPCVAVPGFENNLLLLTPVILDWGLTSAPPFVPTPCNQGIAVYSLTLPTGLPPAIPLRLQSLGQSSTGAFAFGPAIDILTL